MKNRTIRNPLTVIAIFAGIAEASGTAILPFLELENQYIYLWFLIFFPSALIIFFFLTLNFNHRVLYAPSDFNDEANFMDIAIRKLDPEELDTDEMLKGDSVETNEIVPRQKSERIKDLELARDIAIRKHRDAKIAEKLAILKLEKELKAPLELDMELQFGIFKMKFDGISRQENRVKCFEVKYLRSFNFMNNSQWQRLINDYKLLHRSLNDSQKETFEFEFVVVTDETVNQMKKFLKEKFEQVGDLKTSIKVFNYDRLIQEFN